LQFENDKLEFLVERLCLPMNFAVALALFDAAKVEMIPTFIEKIAEIEEEAAKIDQLLPLTNEGKLDALSDLPAKSARLMRSRLLPRQSRIAALIKTGTSLWRLRTSSVVLLSLQKCP
jgi:hypothetical protein